MCLRVFYENDIFFKSILIEIGAHVLKKPFYIYEPNEQKI